jgi:hypothetical protein
MNRSRYFTIGIIALLALSAFDLLSTWILTPDLANEANAFVVWYGFGWIDIILVNLGIILFISIPFYYHSLVFNYSTYTEQKPSITTVVIDYFFRSHKNPFLSVLRALFNGLGYFLLWWYVISKLTAIIHNTLSILKLRFWDIPFSRKMLIMEEIVMIFLIIMMILFFVKLVLRAKKSRISNFNTKSIHTVFLIIFVCLYISFKVFTSFAKSVHSVQLTTKVDPEIVLVNIEDGDRAFIANLLLRLETYKPALIALDAFLVPEKNGAFDSQLSGAFTNIKNDLIAYGFDSTGKLQEPQLKFSALTKDIGFVATQEINGLASHIIPIQKIDNQIRECLALKVVKVWKPGFEHSLRINQSIPIIYTRKLQQYIHLNGSNIYDIDSNFLRNKVVLVGYLGPTQDDKHFTPIRLKVEYPSEEPDTYGVVILANEISTILHYERKPLHK